MINPSATEEPMAVIPAGPVTETSAPNNRSERPPSAAPSPATARNGQSNPVPTEADAPAAMTELRRILFGEEQDKLRRLQHRLDDPKQQSEEISRVLPGAIRLRNKQDQQLTVALTTTVEDSIATSVKTNPKRLSDALYPIIGPAIRAAVSHALGTMLQSLNETLNSSFSPQGFKWRFEGLRTGKSFGEIVLLHTLLYRVEQAFLIHRQTGLLLLQATAPAVAAQDPQLVSGMLTAIQDFVGDSFSVGQGETLESLEVGKLKVWIVQGPHAVLATVIRGEAPEGLRNLFQEVLENIHLQHAAELEDFNGDAALFEISRPELERCLQRQLAEVGESAAKKKVSRLAVLSAILLLLPGTWLFISIRDRLRWNDYLNRLQAQPGIVVVKAERNIGGYFISGLRDPLAADPAQILAATPLDPAKVDSRWQPYQDLSPPLIEARARILLQPPREVSLSLKNNTLYAAGPAPSAWLEEASRLARFLPGVIEFRFEGSSDDQLIAGTSIDFPVRSAEPVPGQEDRFNQLAEAVRRSYLAASVSRSAFQLVVTGNTDELGDVTINQKLRRKRAEKVAALLKSRGVTVPVRIEEGQVNSRRVTLTAQTGEK